MANLLAALRQEVNDIEKQMSRLNRRLQALRAAEEDLAGAYEEKRSRSRLTQEELVRSTLREIPEPWVSSPTELQRLIEERHGTTIKSSSLQPLLSELKRHKVILRDGQRLALTERVQGASEDVTT